jgi:hypothetical protein
MVTPVGSGRFCDPDDFSRAGQEDLLPEQGNILVVIPNAGEGFTIRSEMPVHHQKEVFPDRGHRYARGYGELYFPQCSIFAHPLLDNVLQLLPRWIPPLAHPPTISHLLYRLDSAWRPGLTKKQFKAIFNVCPCGVVAACREFDDARRYCQSVATVVDVDLLGKAQFLHMFHQLNGSGLRKEIFAQIFASCNCGMVMMRRRFHIHECKD